MTKRVSIVLIAFVTFFNVQAQEYKVQIEDEFTSYIEYITARDFDHAMDYVSDDLFSLIHRDQMIELMEDFFNSKEIQIRLSDVNVLSISDVEEVEGRHYSKLVYGNMMHMKFVADPAETDEAYAQRLELIENAFRMKFGPSNVTLDEETNEFEVYTEKDVVAISPDGADKWKFLVVEEGQEAILARILPAEITETL